MSKIIFDLIINNCNITNSNMITQINIKSILVDMVEWKCSICVSSMNFMAFPDCIFHSEQQRAEESMLCFKL